MIVFNANDPSHVASFQVISANLKGDSVMMILSGVALPHLHIDDDDEILREEVRIRFGIKPTELLQYTSNLGLASIDNDESFFLFAVDSSEVFINKETRELELSARIAVSGDHSTINRFSFQVVCFLKSVVARVSGKIVWKKDALQVDKPYHAFEVYAGKSVRKKVGELFFDSIEPFVYGKIKPGSHTTNATEESVEYEITDIPIAEDFIVEVRTINSVKFLSSTKVENFGTSNKIRATATNWLFENVNFLISKNVIK